MVSFPCLFGLTGSNVFIVCYSSDYFCVEEEEEDIDIKIEVVPSLQDMGIELFDGEMPRILPNSPIGKYLCVKKVIF